MPGPKMGPRPPDFDEDVIKQSPTFLKWRGLPEGAKLRYACREFTKGQGDDEERLMRRIMIARRNNIRDHEVLKRARKQQQQQPQGMGSSSIRVDDEPAASSSAATATSAATSGSQGSANASAFQVEASKVALAPALAPPPSAAAPPLSAPRRRRPASTFSDQQVELEMDVAAVEATRSYRAWQELEDGCEFVYNQKYTKGAEGHDWLLRKNIWRRMRYRRDCKKMVERLKGAAASNPSSGDDCVGGGPNDDATDSEDDRPVKRGAAARGVAPPVVLLPDRTSDEPSMGKRKRAPERSGPNKLGRAPPHLVTESSLSLPSAGKVDEPPTSFLVRAPVQRSESGDLDVPDKIVPGVQVTELLQVHPVIAIDAASATERAAAAAAAAESILKATQDADVATAAAEAAADQEAIEAAVAAAESFGKSAHIMSSVTLAAVTAGAPSTSVGSVTDHHHHDEPLDAAALDAAAKLAAATALGQDEDDAAATAAAAAVAASAENLYAAAAATSSEPTARHAHV